MFKPDHYKLEYYFDTEKKTFRQFKLHTAEIPDLLPDLIRLEVNNGYNSIQGANNLLRIRDTTNWSKCSLAGLRPTGTPNFYYSDLPVNGVKSFIVVYLPPDRQNVVIRVCRAFYPKGNPDFREKLTKEIIKSF